MTTWLLSAKETENGKIYLKSAHDQISINVTQ